MPDALDPPFDDPASFFVVLFLAILVGPILARVVRLPPTVGLVLVGTAVGSGGLGLLQRDGSVALLGGAGLLFLMFLAGLDLDRSSFRQQRDAALVFSVSTTVLPLVLTTAAGLALGLDLGASVLLASAFTSHTLVTYPVVQRFGLAEARASVIALGGTLVSTVVALLVLAVVAAAHSGTLGLSFWAGFVGGIALFFAATLTGLPRLASWFFTGLGTDRAVRYSFTLALPFGAALLADVLGIEPIIGAFVAGLALNRYVSGDTLLLERVKYLGSSLLVPVFLVSTGMLIDPGELVTDPESLLLGGALTLAALAAKALSVLPIRLITRLDRAELGLLVGLTSAQAAGALAAAIVALEIGLIQVREVNAVVLVILLSCVFSGILTERSAQRIPRPDRGTPEIGAAVVVPIADIERAEPLVEIASAIARRDRGVVLAVTILNFDAAPDEVVELRDQLTERVEGVALAGGADLRSMVRIDVTASAGMLHTAIESGASSILLGWKGFSARGSEYYFGEDTDAIVTLSPLPVFVCRTAPLEPSRVVVDVTARDLAASAHATTRLCVEVAMRLGRRFEVPVEIVSALPERDVRAVVGEDLPCLHDDRSSLRSLPERTEPGDIVIGGLPPTRAGLDRRAARLAGALPDRTVVMVAGR